jgi:hypothetical protein
LAQASRLPRVSAIIMTVNFGHRVSVALAALAAALLIALLAAVPGGAIVPPKNCGSVTVKHHRYNIKGDQLPCTQARRYASGFLGHRKSPHGYKCHRNSGSALVAQCVNTHTNPDRTIFMIKR